MTSSRGVFSAQLVEDIESRIGVEPFEGVTATIVGPVGNLVINELEDELLDGDSPHGALVGALFAVPSGVVVAEPALKRVRRLRSRS